jgi:hypothetical protein
LRRAGVLVLDLDVLPEALGYHVEARLWLTVRPTGLAATAAAVAAHPETSLPAPASLAPSTRESRCQHRRVPFFRDLWLVLENATREC